jgi:hypothetical protein
MKKIIIICIVGILLFTAFGAVATTNTEQTKDNQNQGSRDFTHTVFGEYGTETTCSYCIYAHGALKQIYDEGQYPFYYVSLVYDKNVKAQQRCTTDYNVYGFPTLWFDGGYKVNVGASSIPSAKAAYISSITQCGSRIVKDIDVNLIATWLGGTNMEISATVTNNEIAEYGGHIRVYITEKISSMGWHDLGGSLYTFPLLDYAFNQDLTIPAGDSWTNTMQWDGATHGFPSITENNIMLIAAVFNAESHQGYSYPPSSNPFTAHYVDDTAAFEFGGGPNTPSNPNPANGANNVVLTAKPSWTGGGSPGLTITYDVYFGTASSPPKVSNNQSATTYNPGTLNYGTTYYWKIVAWDQNGNTSGGPIWHFTTLANPNNPPNKPTITGPAKVGPGQTYRYTVTATDPDQDAIYGYIDWGDNTSTVWIGPYDSGEAFSVSHSWAAKGTYAVKAKVKDEYGAESAWANLTVKVPTSYSVTNPFLHWLFEQFPNAFPVLRQLLGV